MSSDTSATDDLAVAVTDVKQDDNDVDDDDDLSSTFSLFSVNSNFSSSSLFSMTSSSSSYTATTTSSVPQRLELRFQQEQEIGFRQLQVLEYLERQQQQQQKQFKVDNQNFHKDTKDEWKNSILMKKVAKAVITIKEAAASEDFVAVVQPVRTTTICTGTFDFNSVTPIESNVPDDIDNINKL